METTWFIMDTGLVVLYYLLGMAIWAGLKYLKDLEEASKIVDGYFLATAAILISWFSIGLWCLLVLLFFNISVFLIDLKIKWKGEE